MFGIFKLVDSCITGVRLRRFRRQLLELAGVQKKKARADMQAAQGMPPGAERSRLLSYFADRLKAIDRVEAELANPPR